MHILRSITHDRRTAASRLRTRPAYALMAAGMLALAIGSNVAVFTVLSRTLLRPFPFDSERLVRVYSSHLDAAGKLEDYPASSLDFVQWKSKNSTLQSLELIRIFAGAISDRGETESIKVGWVSGGLFRMLDVRPQIGSDFAPGDDRPESNAVILSHGLWTRRMGAARDVVGRGVVINGRPMIVRGVMPRQFEIPGQRADAYVPLGFSLNHAPDPAARTYIALGRLKNGITPAAAQADLQRIANQLAAAFPQSHEGWGVLVKTFTDSLFGAQRTALLTLFVAVLLVHVLACVNVANLMLAQITDQRAVTAVRLAIGAPPGQIVRYRVAEGLVISIAAALVGLAGGVLGVQAILRAYADRQLLEAPAGAGLMIALFVVGLTILTGLLISLVPALRESRVPIAALINQGSQRTSSSVEGRRARELFITAEVALVIPLLIGSAIAVKRLQDLRSIDIGFKPDGLLTAQLIMPPRYDGPKRTEFVAEFLRRMNRAPGVASAAVTTSGFRVDGGAGTTVRSESMADFAAVSYRRITPRFFETMSTPLLAGRPFHDSDVADSPPVAIVSQAFAKRFWPGQNPIGKKLMRNSRRLVWATVVGVAPNIRDVGVAEDLDTTLYTPFYQGNSIYVSVVARAHGSPQSIREALKRSVLSVDGTMAPDEVVPFRQLVEETLGSYKLQVALLGGFGLIALALAAVGIFAVTSYAVSQRMPEVGVRMAFGATPARVVGELVRAAGKSVTAGVLLGLALTVAVANTAPLFGSLKPVIDPAYATVVVSILVLAALLATLLPALRARTAQPAELLRRA